MDQCPRENCRLGQSGIDLAGIAPNQAKEGPLRSWLAFLSEARKGVPTLIPNPHDPNPTPPLNPQRFQLSIHAIDSHNSNWWDHPYLNMLSVPPPEPLRHWAAAIPCAFGSKPPVSQWSDVSLLRTSLNR